MKISDTLKNQIYFVIPAFNEGKAIDKVIENLIKKNYSHLILIDDGSKDNTFKIINDYAKKYKNIVPLSHVINRGQGASLKTGINYALKQEECKYIVTFDSDGQHRISDLENLITPLEKNRCDIAIGSRFLKKESTILVPRKKQILLKGALLVTIFLSSIKLTDTHNGYRVMNKKAAKNIDITMDGFEHASEIIDEISKKKIRYEEVPVFIDYTTYSKAKGQKISNSIKILFKIIFKGK